MEQTGNDILVHEIMVNAIPVCSIIKTYEYSFIAYCALCSFLKIII